MAQGSPLLSAREEKPVKRGSEDFSTILNGKSGHPVLLNRKQTPNPITPMKKHRTSKNSISLGDLVASVSSYARNEREVVAAISDLFRRGDVVAKTRHGTKRLKLA
jgi:hypothetical protein